ncbi:MAG: DUF2490 domain-containing protein [Bacteroidota bacterium]
MRKVIILLGCLLIGGVLSAQDLSQDFKNWYLVSTNLRFTKTTSLSIGHLSSFDLDGYRYGFRQNRVSLQHKLNSQWTANLGYAYSVIKGRTRNIPYHRVEAQISHRVKWDHWRMTNSLRLEKYGPQLPKYGARAILSNKWSYYNRNWPLRFSPYIRNQVFYYQGGEEIAYLVDPEELEDGEEGVIWGAPNGWHRYRFSVGGRMRLRRDLYLTVFYTWQKEFNTGLRPYNQLNVPQESGTKNQLPFNNYSLLGVSLAYTFKFY